MHSIADHLWVKTQRKGSGGTGGHLRPKSATHELDWSSKLHLEPRGGVLPSLFSAAVRPGFLYAVRPKEHVGNRFVSFVQRRSSWASRGSPYRCCKEALRPL